MTSVASASFALILHAHLPFVRHPEHENFLEEDWLFEAITETYLPLLRLMRRLVDDGVGFKLTMSLTPTLCAMLRDELLQERYLRHLERLIGLAEQETERNRHDTQLARIVSLLRSSFSPQPREFFDETLRRDIVRAFRELQDAGCLEIIASAATHAFLPLLQDFPEAQRAQVRIGCDSYREMFGREPGGFWLPECGYSHGLDALLQEANLRWFVLDTHGLMFAQPRPQLRDLCAVLHAGGSGRLRPRSRIESGGLERGKRLSGRPGLPRFLPRCGLRSLGGRAAAVSPSAWSPKIHRPQISSRDRTNGRKGTLQSGEGPGGGRRTRRRFFRESASACLRELREMNFDPVIVSPFDAELFGHWWFEGPRFLESFLRRAAREREDFQLATPTEFLATHPSQQVVRPNPSSWGEHGFNSVWLEENNAWIYPHLHAATRRMTEMARAPV